MSNAWSNARSDYLDLPLNLGNSHVTDVLRSLSQQQSSRSFDLTFPILPEEEHKQLQDLRWYKNPRLLGDELVGDSRLIFNLDYLRFGKIHRRNPTEAAFRFTFQNGIFLNFQSFDLSIYLQEIGSHTVRGRVIPPRVEYHRVAPCGAQVNEVKDEVEGFQDLNEDGYHVDGEEKMKEMMDSEEFALKYRFRSLRNQQAIRYISIPNSSRSFDDQLPQSFPIFFSLKHTGTFAFRFFLKVTYTISPPFLPSSTKATPINRTFAYNVFCDKDSRVTGLDDWNTASQDIETEIKNSSIEMVSVSEKQVKLPKADGQGSKSASLPIGFV